MTHFPPIASQQSSELQSGQEVKEIAMLFQLWDDEDLSGQVWHYKADEVAACYHSMQVGEVRSLGGGMFLKRVK